MLDSEDTVVNSVDSAIEISQLVVLTSPAGRKSGMWDENGRAVRKAETMIS